MRLNEQYTSKELISFIGERMKMVCVDGEIIIGEMYSYINEHDSDDGYVHVYIYSPKIDGVVDVGEDEISQFSPA